MTDHAALVKDAELLIQDCRILLPKIQQQPQWGTVVSRLHDVIHVIPRLLNALRPSPETQLVRRLRAVADREDPGPIEPWEADAVLEDVPEFTIEEIREIVGLLREAAAALAAAPVPPATELGVAGSEVLCEECAKVFCPHAERLHFHHDGCPACKVDTAAEMETPEGCICPQDGSTCWSCGGKPCAVPPATEGETLDPLSELRLLDSELDRLGVSRVKDEIILSLWGRVQSALAAPALGQTQQREVAEKIATQARYWQGHPQCFDIIRDAVLAALAAPVPALPRMSKAEITKRAQQWADTHAREDDNWYYVDTLEDFAQSLQLPAVPALTEQPTVLTHACEGCGGMAARWCQECAAHLTVAVGEQALREKAEAFVDAHGWPDRNTPALTKYMREFVHSLASEGT